MQLRNLTFRQLRSIIEIAHSSHLNKAAERLGLTPPALTIQIKQIERDYGVTIVERHRNNLRLTEYGQVFYHYALQIDKQLNNLDHEIMNRKQGVAGILQFGVTSTGKYIAPKIITEFMKLFPQADISLMIGNKYEIIDALALSKITIALMGKPSDEQAFQSYYLADNPYVFVASPNHVLAREKNIALSRIIGERLFIRENLSGTRKALEVLLHEFPQRLENLGTEMRSNESIKQAVISDLGIAFLSAHTMAVELQYGKLAILDVVGLPIIKPWHLVMNEGQFISPIMQQFMAFMQGKGHHFFPNLQELKVLHNPKK